MSSLKIDILTTLATAFVVGLLLLIFRTLYLSDGGEESDALLNRQCGRTRVIGWGAESEADVDLTDLVADLAGQSTPPPRVE